MNEDDGVFSIVETRPETFEKNTIAWYADKEVARAHLRTLNLGGGFDGWTPDFILTQNQTTDIVGYTDSDGE